MKTFIKIFGSFINHRRTKSAGIAGSKDFESALLMIMFPTVLWCVGTLVSFIPFIGVIGALWKGATVAGHLLVGWLYWPFLFFYIINLFVQWSWYDKKLRLRIFESQKTELNRTKLVQKILLRGLKKSEYVKFRQHAIYLSAALGLLFSYHFTARIDYWLSGSPTAFVYYKDLPIVGEKHALFETLQEGMRASPRVTDKVKAWCDVGGFPWDVCLELKSYPGFEWQSSGSWTPRMTKNLENRLSKAFEDQ